LPVPGGPHLTYISGKDLSFCNSLRLLYCSYLLNPLSCLMTVPKCSYRWS
jgi:hypothetical protein